MRVGFIVRNVADEGFVQWAETDLQQPARSDVLLPAPRLYEPAGKRFKLLQGDSPTSRVFQ